MKVRVFTYPVTASDQFINRLQRTLSSTRMKFALVPEGVKEIGCELPKAALECEPVKKVWCNPGCPRPWIRNPNGFERHLGDGNISLLWGSELPEMRTIRFCDSCGEPRPTD